MNTEPARSGPLSDIRVLDVATLFAGPGAATILADFGADVVKIEHPDVPDGARTHGRARNGVGLWWKTLARNKSALTLNLSKQSGREIFLRLVEMSDVVIENFRPGTLEKWGLGYDVLKSVNPRLVLVRVTGFGQTGPMASQPAFGTLAEAMSGFAYSTGQADGPPTLPPLALADNIAALSAALATMMALHARTASGVGQVVDLAIIEPMLAMLGPQLLNFDQLGVVAERAGNRSENNAPRNTYRTADGRWVAISSSATSIAARVMTLVGRPEVTREPWFASGHGRAAHADELDAAVGAWIGERTLRVVLAAFESAEAAIAPVNDISQVMDDPQYNAIGAIVTVADDDLGPVRMQNVLFRMSGTPGSVRHTGRSHGQDTDRILRELGYSSADIENFRAEGAV
jgi:crotonobetainyl-CoA:carnitine CoA-transferase CaiB-like acyl-CoA transferase